MTSDFLEKMAYIMIIIVCFTILITILVYFICLLLKKRTNSKYCAKHAKEKEGICINPKCVVCLNEWNVNKSNIDSNMDKNDKQVSDVSKASLIDKNDNLNNDNNQSSNNGLFNQILNRLKSAFFLKQEQNNAEKPEENDNNIHKDSFITLNGSVIVNEKESNLLDTKKKLSKSNIPKSIRKSKSSNRKTSIISSSVHSVKFKDNEMSDAFSSDDSSSIKNSASKTSDYSSMKSSNTSSKKNSISSYSNSRKSSSISSTYNEPSVVDYYRRKRYSDASSVYTTNTSLSDLTNRKLSINYPNNLKDSYIKLIALEQQPSISNPLFSKKSSISSVTTTSSKISSSQGSYRAGGRRYSIMTPPTNVCDKFWVPPEIAKNVQLEKQRSSLSNSDIIFEFNEKLSELKSEANGLDEIKENQAIETDFNSKTDSMQQNISRRESNTSTGVAISSTRNSTTPGRRRASMFDPIDPTELQKTLYQNLKSNQEQNSSNSEDQAVDSIGTFEFGIQYLSDSQKLVVDLLRVFDLQFKDNNPNCDLYCKCALMPDKLSFQTKLLKRNANPIFEEQFEFDYLDTAKLESRYLEISLHELDKLTKEDCLGVANIKLNYPNIENKKIFLRDIKPYIRPREENYIGDLMFSLAYLPAAERLTIVVIKARNLQGLGPDRKLLPDPFVKVSILTKDGKKLKKKKTSSQKGTMCPIYNEEIVFTNLKKEQLNDIIIQFLVYHDSITNRELLGSVSISSSSKGNEYIQWKDMLESKKSIAWWHPLNSLNTNVDSDFNPNQNLNSNFRKNSKSINLFNFKQKPVSILSNNSINKQPLAENS